VDPAAVDAVATEVARRYRERTGIDGDAHVLETADGLTVAK
jgi:galactokinase